jgi:hypothetical protein
MEITNLGYVGVIFTVKKHPPKSAEGAKVPAHFKNELKFAKYPGRPECVLRIHWTVESKDIFELTVVDEYAIKKSSSKERSDAEKTVRQAYDRFITTYHNLIIGQRLPLIAPSLDDKMLKGLTDLVMEFLLSDLQ